MATFTTRDDVTIYYKDWGPRDGKVVILSHGWPLNADSWESQAFFLASNGYRVITHDRRGHGRSSQPWEGNDMDHYADDLAQLIEQLESAQRLALRLLDRRRRSRALCRPPRHEPRRPHRAHLRRAADHAAHGAQSDRPAASRCSTAFAQPASPTARSSIATSRAARSSASTGPAPRSIKVSSRTSGCRE